MFCGFFISIAEHTAQSEIEKKEKDIQAWCSATSMRFMFIYFIKPSISSFRSFVSFHFVLFFISFDFIPSTVQSNEMEDDFLLNIIFFLSNSPYKNTFCLFYSISNHFDGANVQF